MDVRTATTGTIPSDRPLLPVPPPGTYAVPDPDNPDVITLWRSTGTALTPGPPGNAGPPYPPRTPATMPCPERTAARRRWYACRNWPWKTAVVDAIRADPLAAAPSGSPSSSPPTSGPGPARRAATPTGQEAADRAARALVAAALAADGWSYARIADRLDVARFTAWRWARIAARDGDRLQALVLDAALDDTACRP